jgi:hypothetical protein
MNSKLFASFERKRFCKKGNLYKKPKPFPLEWLEPKTEEQIFLLFYLFALGFKP